METELLQIMYSFGTLNKYNMSSFEKLKKFYYKDFYELKTAKYAWTI